MIWKSLGSTFLGSAYSANGFSAASNSARDAFGDAVQLALDTFGCTRHLELALQLYVDCGAVRHPEPMLREVNLHLHGAVARARRIGGRPHAPAQADLAGGAALVPGGLVVFDLEPAFDGLRAHAEETRDLVARALELAQLPEGFEIDVLLGTAAFIGAVEVIRGRHE